MHSSVHSVTKIDLIIKYSAQYKHSVWPAVLYFMSSENDSSSWCCVWKYWAAKIDCSVNFCILWHNCSFYISSSKYPTLLVKVSMCLIWCPQQWTETKASTEAVSSSLHVSVNCGVYAGTHMLQVKKSQSALLARSMKLNKMKTLY